MIPPKSVSVVGKINERFVFGLWLWSLLASLPLTLLISIQIKQCFLRLCVPTCCTCSCCLPSITAQLTPLQVPGQHFLIAFRVPVMLGAALLLAIHHPAIVAVRCLSHMTSPTECARRECQQAGCQPGCCSEFVSDLKYHR